MKYYDFWNNIDEGDALLKAGKALPMIFTNWLSGCRWSIPVPKPLEVEIETRGRLLPYYQDPMPIMHTALLEKLKGAGVDNIDDYDVLITDIHSGERFTDYRAINIIGVISAVDNQNSIGSALDESGQFGTFYDKIIIDENKTRGALAFRLEENLSYFVVAESAREAMLSYLDSESLRFTPLFETNDEYLDEPMDEDDLE